MIVPIKIFIWVTPEAKILGSNFLKKILTLSSILNDNFILGEKYFFTKKYKKTNCKTPEAVTA